MSSALLYLAIVVVWVLVLVPTWVRRDPTVPRRRTASTPAGDEQADTLDDTGAAEGMAPDDTEASIPDPAGTATSGHRAVHADAPVVGDAVSPTGDTARSARQAPEPPAGRPSGHRRPEDPARHRAHQRARVVARRRRRTTGLVLLLLALAPVTVLAVAPWWIVVPPAMLLAGHLTMLRTAVRADAEHARALAEAHRRQREAARRRRAAEERAARERAAQQAATAEVIDLTERTEQPVYDQYTDAELRAVGD